MGVQGLLPTLKSIITPVHVREYAGLKVAIDTYSWLHKAAFTCSKDLCEGRPTDKFIQYCMHRVNLLRHHGVRPLLVFDGGALPSKIEQEEKRARSREEQLRRAQEHERSGNPTSAMECYQRAVDITPSIALQLIKVLRREGVEYIVAPYEADAQMAYLALHDIVQVVITEDSDLIAYGCPRVLFKMDKSGQGEEFQYSDIVRNKELSFTNFTRQMVLEMCILSGCDYLPSLPGMGIKRAHGFIRKYKSYQKVLRHLRFSGITVSPDYEEKFRIALLTFRHQRVYDPVSERMVHVTGVPNDETSDLEFLGPYLPEILMKAIAVGEVDPCTKLPFQEEVITRVGPDDVQRFSQKTFAQQMSSGKSKELLVQKNVMTNYFFSPSKEAKKQFKAPRNTSGVQDKNSTSSERGCFRTTPPDTLVSSRFLETKSTLPDLSTVFGSPLPDDDEIGSESESEAGWHVRDKVENKAENQQFMMGATHDRRKSDDDSSNLKSVTGMREHSDGLDRVDVKAEGVVESTSCQRIPQSSGSVAEKFVWKERKTDYLPTQWKGSEYFTKKRMVQTSLVRLDFMVCETDRTEDFAKDADRCCEKVMKKSKVVSSEVENAEKEILLCKGSSQEVSPLSHVRSKLRNPVSDEKQKPASPFSRFLHQSASSKLDEFSSNVAHVGNYARIAESSMERFVKAITPLRCTSKGTRVSGLRAPSKIVPVPQKFKR